MKLLDVLMRAAPPASRFLSCVLLPLLLLTESSADRPNIVLILADDMGWSDLGCYGSEIPTPHIDSLASQGMLATRCYTAARFHHDGVRTPSG